MSTHLVDECDGRAVITGASLAGALRNYVREFEWGYESLPPERDIFSEYYDDTVWLETHLLATALCGADRRDPEGAQSPLIIDDAFSTQLGLASVELRDGVAIDPKTRTALAKKKYDYQLLPVGTRFHLRFELLLDD